jgi:FKBP-type peptidyl-prolyl cis-trans isomerase
MIKYMSKNALLGLEVISVVIALVVAAWWWKQSDTTTDKLSTSTATDNTTTPTPSVTNTTQGGTMQSEDLIVGTGEEAVTGKTVTVNYIGTFTNGTKFDASYDRNQPFSFTLGAGGVIEGWDKGVVGMKVGGKRKLTIPSDMAYGPNDYNGIPGGSTLIFEIELLKVE